MKLMGGKIKKFFLNFNRLNKPAVLATVFFFIFLGLSLPSQFVQAIDVFGPILAIPTHIINALLQILLIASNLFLGLASVILNWVLSPYFTTLPYTHGGIVEVGWPIVRDFINMFFVIALVVIGLATALRIKEYQLQKALPRLIAIAILINFTPVICGLIIDAANILMNFFLEEMGGFKMMINFFVMQGSSVQEAITHFFDFRYAVSALGKTIVMIIFDWVAGFIFLIYSLLFIMRYIMIWVLVIVSPIAFFSRIFPDSQKYLFKSILGWDEWWKQFIEWTLLGVVAMFFLYLAEQLMMLAPSMISGLPPGQGAIGGVDNPLVEFVNNFLPWMVVLAFLFIGFLVATSTSALGAGAITKLAKKSSTAMRKVPPGAAWKFVKTTGGSAVWRGVKGIPSAVRHPKRTAGAVWTGVKAAPGRLRYAIKHPKVTVKTGARYTGRGFRKAWEEAGKPIFEAGWEPFRKEIFGPRKGEEPEIPGRPEKAPGETDEEFASRLGDWEDEVKEWTQRRRERRPPEAAPPTKPTPPLGVPPDWVPGPGGIWVPPPKEEKIAKEPRGRRGISKVKEVIKKVKKGPRGRRGV